MTQNTTNGEGSRRYYYRPLAHRPGFYKCVGFGAEDSKHREIYEPFFNRDTDGGRFLHGCIISPYIGDRPQHSDFQREGLVPSSLDAFLSTPTVSIGKAQVAE